MIQGMPRFSLPTYPCAAKQILEVQGFSIFSKKLKRLMFSNYQNTHLKKIISEYAQKYDVFIDIGAKVGNITISVAKNFSKCICFEPSKENYNELIKRINDKNLENIVSYNCALGDSKKNGNLYLSPNSSGQNRLNVTPEEKWEEQEIMVNTLDDILEGLSLDKKFVIKIDVEGSELNVMKGGIKTLSKDCVIITEFWPWGLRVNNVEPIEYVNFMKSKGYSFFDISGEKVVDNYLERLCSQNKRFVTDDFLLKRSKSMKK